MAVSEDLREVVDQTPKKVVVATTITNTPLLSYPIPASAGTGVAVNVALDPTLSELRYQAGKGSLSVLDWTQVGPPHFAATRPTRQAAADLTITPAGRVVDLTVPRTNSSAAPPHPPTCNGRLPPAHRDRWRFSPAAARSRSGTPTRDR